MLRHSSRTIHRLLQGNSTSKARISVHKQEFASRGSEHSSNEPVGSLWPSSPQKPRHEAPAVDVSEDAHPPSPASGGSRKTWSPEPPPRRNRTSQPSLDFELLQDSDKDVTNDEGVTRLDMLRRSPIARRHTRGKRSGAQSLPGERTNLHEIAAKSNATLHRDLKEAVTSQNISRAARIFEILRARGALEGSETDEIVRLLKTSTMHGQLLEQLVESYRNGNIPANDRATSAFIEHFMHKHDGRAISFIDWALHQKNPKYCSLFVYAYAIRVYSKQGRGLSACVSLYEKAQKKFGSALSQTLLKPNAPLKNLHEAFSTSSMLSRPLCEMACARFRLGDWRRGYLDIDTILRLYPGELQGSLYDIMSARPLSESFQLLCVVLRSGGVMRPKELTKALTRLKVSQNHVTSQAMTPQLSRAMLALLHLTSRNNSLNEEIPWSLLIRAATALLPSHRKQSSANQAAEIDAMTTRLLTQVLKLFQVKDLSVTDRTMSSVVSAAFDADNEAAFQFALEYMRQNGIIPSSADWLSLSKASARPGWSDLVEKWWLDWSKEVRKSLSLHRKLVGSFAAALQMEQLPFLARSPYDASWAEKKIFEGIQLSFSRVRTPSKPGQYSNKAPIATCLEDSQTFSSALSQLEQIIADRKHCDLFRNPPERMTLLPRSLLDNPHEEWERELFEEMYGPSGADTFARPGSYMTTQSQGRDAEHNSGEAADTAANPGAEAADNNATDNAEKRTMEDSSSRSLNSPGSPNVTKTSVEASAEPSNPRRDERPLIDASKSISDASAEVLKHDVAIATAVDKAEASSESPLPEVHEKTDPIAKLREHLFDDLPSTPVFSTEATRRGSSPGASGSEKRKPLTSTGYPLAALRFQNWCAINNLLAEADYYEREINRRVAAGDFPPTTTRDPASVPTQGDIAWLQRDLDIYVRGWQGEHFYAKDKEGWKKQIRALRGVEPPPTS